MHSGHPAKPGGPRHPPEACKRRYKPRKSCVAAGTVDAATTALAVAPCCPPSLPLLPQGVRVLRYAAASRIALAPEDAGRNEVQANGCVLQEGEEIPLAVASLMKVPLVTHELPSSGLLYINIGLSLADLSLEDVDYLPLFSRMMIEAGTSELPPEVLMPLVGQATGGISAAFAFQSAPSKPFTIPDQYAARGIFYLSGKVSCALHLEPCRTTTSLVHL